MRLIVILCLVTANVASAGSLEIDVRKAVYGPEESPYYSQALNFKCKKDNCREELLVEHIDGVYSTILNAVDPDILAAAKSTFLKACDEFGDCRNGAAAKSVILKACSEIADCRNENELVWDRFLELSGSVKLKSGVDFVLYTYAMYDSLAYSFGIERNCAVGAYFCKWIYGEVSGSPHMVAEMLFRGAVLMSLKINFSFDDLIDSMGDMVVRKKNGDS